MKRTSAKRSERIEDRGSSRFVLDVFGQAQDVDEGSEAPSPPLLPGGFVQFGTVLMEAADEEVIIPLLRKAFERARELKDAAEADLQVDLAAEQSATIGHGG